MHRFVVRHHLGRTELVCLCVVISCWFNSIYNSSSSNSSRDKFCEKYVTLIKTICPTAAHAQLSSVCLWFDVVLIFYLLNVTFLIYALDLVSVFVCLFVFFSVCIYLYLFFTIWLLFFTINNISQLTPVCIFLPFVYTHLDGPIHVVMNGDEENET